MDIDRWFPLVALAITAIGNIVTKKRGLRSVFAATFVFVLVVAQLRFQYFFWTPEEFERAPVFAYYLHFWLPGLLFFPLLTWNLFGTSTLSRSLSLVTAAGHALSFLRSLYAVPPALFAQWCFYACFFAVAGLVASLYVVLMFEIGYVSPGPRAKIC
jgi:hypothetical protein